MADYMHSPSMTLNIYPVVKFSLELSPKNPAMMFLKAPSDGLSILNSALARKMNLFLKSYESSLVY